MKTRITLFFTIAILLLAGTTTSFGQAKKTVAKKTVKTAVKAKPAVKKPAPKKETDNSVKVRIITDSGTIVVKLYDSTPLHRDNFVKLVQAGFYDSLMFHRVMKNFMIQGGDPDSKYAPSGVMLGAGGGDMERIPAEFLPSLYHKKGALAAARDGNPEKKSSACQFYIVEGKICSDAELDMYEKRKGIKYTTQQREVYKTLGGAAFLDQDYTVFGEVLSGLEVIPKISGVPQDGANRPFGDIRMKMELIK